MDAVVERMAGSGLFGVARNGERERAAFRRELVRSVGRIGTRPDLDAAGFARRATRHGAAAVRGGVPPARLLASYELCFTTVQEQLWAGAAKNAATWMRPFNRSAAEWLGAACAAAESGAAAELRRAGRAADALEMLAAVLLLGHGASALAACAAITPAPRYQVLVGVTEPAARPWREPGFTAELREAPPVLNCVDGGDLVALLPAGERAPSVDRLIERSREAGTRWAASRPVPVADLPVAVRQARRTARLAYAAALPAGAVVREDEIVVEALTLADPVLRPWLDGIAAALRKDTELIRTVTMLYQAELDRGRAAELLGIARRTLNSRLNRIHQLTGFKPTATAGIQVLGLALSANRLAAVAEGSGT